MNSRNFMAWTRLALVILLMFWVVSGVGAPPLAAQTKAGPGKMRSITNAQRKAAAARAAARRAAAAAQQGAEAPVGPPGGAALTPDQLYFGTYPNYANSPLPTKDPITGAPTGGGIRKFVDTLPSLCGFPNGINNLGQCIPIATPDTVTFPGSDYYEIAVQQYPEKMHTDLPATLLRGYVQLNNGTDANGSNTVAPAPIHYLGPLILAQSNKPVRIKFTNMLPYGPADPLTGKRPGDLFIPVDTTVMGAGMGADGTLYTQNRATLHLHGGNTPWISDGTPHQWTVPALETTNFKKGVSTQNVPDMFFVNGVVVPQCTAVLITNCSPAVLPVPNPSPLPLGATNDPGDGSMTFYYTNQQSARLMMYHDHAYGITRLNAYAGEAAAYLLMDQFETTLMNGGTLPGTAVYVPPGTIPGLLDEIPLVIQDKTFVPPNPATAPVYSIGILQVGSGYTNPTVTIDAGGVCATTPTATATAGTIVDPFGQFIFGAITGITLTNAGAGCTSVPTVAIADTLGGTGTGAAAFASLATLGQQDPTWDPALWGGTGNLWFPHVYMPNQYPDNPDGSNTNPMGRWDYASWFWPPFNGGIYRERGPIACPTLAIPNQQCPGTPSALNPGINGSVASLTPEAFLDTPVVNGTAYPTVTVDPKPYRLRMLSIGNDRTLNLSWFVACGTGGYTPSAAAMPCPVPQAGLGIPNGTEVGMVPAAPNPAFPVWWPTDGRDGGVPDPAGMGPSWLALGSEGGFLPNLVTIPPAPVNYEYDRRSVTVLNISTHSLLLMPAERADVIVDFSAFAGKTLILYNDAPAPAPAFDTRYDYYTGDPDQTGTGGAPSTLPGFGPNTRTIMQVVVNPGTGTPFNAAPLQAALPAVFKASQPGPVVPEAAYNAAFGANFPNTYGRLQDNFMTFTPIGAAAPTTIQLGMKAIQELFELDYGRMNSTLGTELVFTNFNTQTTIPLGYIDPASEIIKDSSGVIGQPVGVAGDGSQIWKIVHNGVDSHAIHFHLFDVQVVNRTGWDGTIRPPDPNEQGWKDTVRMNPLEIAYVALRPFAQTMPFPLPDSIRPLDVTWPVDTTDPALSRVGPDGGRASQINVLANFGWEYVWHCHILGHEENDMMRSIIFQVPPPAPANVALYLNPWNPGGLAVDLTWTDMSFSASQPGGGFNVQVATDSGFLNLVVSANGIGGSTGFGSTVLFPVNAVQGQTYYYRVQAFSANGTSAWTVASGPPLAALTAMTMSAPPITYGQVGVVTVTVTSPLGTVTGNVALSVDGVAQVPLALSGAPGSAVFNLTGLTAGVHTLSATYPPVPDPMIVTSTAAGTITVNPAPLIITAPSLTLTYGSPVPTITPNVVGLAPWDSVADLVGLTCTTTYTQGTPVGTYLGANTCSGAVNANYATPITYVAGAMTVTPAPASVTPDALSKVYGTADPVLTGTLTGFMQWDVVTATYTRAAGETVAGSPYTISATLTATGSLTNYAITYNTAQFTITPAPASVTPDALGKVYGTADPPFTGTLTGFLNADGVTATYSRTLGENAGPYTISATLAPVGVLSNYTITYNTAPFTITPAPASVTPAAATKVYGTAEPAFTGSLSGFLAADGVTATYSRTAGETVLGSPYTISATLAPVGVLSNYTITYNTALFTITPAAASVTPDAATKTYGAADPALTGVLAGLLAADNVTATYTRTAGETVAGSPYTISATLAPAGVLSNYTITYNTALFTITAAPLIITGPSATIPYGDPVPPMNPIITGLVNGDTQANLSGLTCTTTYVQGNPVGTYPTSCSGAVNANYTITYASGAVTVTPALASVTPNAATKVYGTADPPLTGTLTGFLQADNVTATYTRAAGETVAGSPYTISATLAPAGVLSNYSITYNTAPFTITLAAASVTPNAASKVYGTADPALSGTLTGFLQADNVTATYTRAAGETVAGSPYTISATLNAAPGVLANYNIILNTANFTITQAPATVTINAASKQYGTPDPPLICTPTGFLPADNVTVTCTRASGETVGTYVISATLAPAGVLANYNITIIGAAFTITQAPASVTPNPNSKIFGQADPVPLTTGTLTGFLNADGVTATYSRTAGETVVGSPYTISATLAPPGVLGNYNITYNTAVFTINKATSATTITSNTPNPANLNQPVLVSFSVAPQFGGTPSGNVTVTANTGESCTAALAAGTGSCSVTFLSPGAKTLTATYAGDTNFLASTSPGVSQVVLGPVAFVSPTALTFANQVLFTNSPRQNVTLSNLGNGTLTINSITIVGPNAGDFTWGGGGGGCGGTLAAGASCLIRVRFRPTAVGPRLATLDINSNDPLNPNLLVSLSGTGVTGAAATLSPTSLTFPAQTVGTTSAPQAVTLTSSGGSALVISGIGIAGGNASNFAQTNNCPIGGAGLAPGASCTINVTFRPTRTGLRTSNLRIADNAANSPQTAPLSGTGQ